MNKKYELECINRLVDHFSPVRETHADDYTLLGKATHHSDRHNERTNLAIEKTYTKKRQRRDRLIVTRYPGGDLIYHEGDAELVDVLSKNVAGLTAQRGVA